ncbi:MAG TPA: shikimate kinase [Gammaproteobacteria bacterium]|nr:shikimate kinase [Gammaproteobacteria bacterium]
MRIFLIGPMGAGKTTVGGHLAAMLQHSFLDSDQIIEQQAAQSTTEIINTHGEQHFRSLEQTVLQHNSLLPNIVLATGGGSILSRETRDLLPARGVICYLKVSVHAQMQRLQNDATRALLPQHPHRLRFLQDMQAKRDCLYEQIADIILDTDNHNPVTLANKLVPLIDNVDTSKRYSY